MSRTAHHSTKHGPLAFGKGYKQRAYGYEFWSRRPCSCQGSGPVLKHLTHRRERRAGERELRREAEAA